ncbi:MAG: SAF domain-containing protein [Acidimicrobiia bacterium]|nr:SAF domain-containing protein [Acidimicrobiia bacterium]
MLLLSRPPYLRWALAATVVIAALLWDLSARRVEPYPFASEDVERGQPITAQVVEWRNLPLGSVERIDVTGSVALTDIRAGDPLTPSVAGSSPPIPEGWWSVPLDLPLGIAEGAIVRLVMQDGTSVDGIVTIAANEDQFGVTRAGAVAVPEEVADAVAVSAGADALTVLVAP